MAVDLGVPALARRHWTGFDALGLTGDRRTDRTFGTN